MGSCWLWDKLVVFFTQVSICSHFGVMGVLVMLLEHLARLIASFAETWRHESFTVPKSVPKSSVLNKIGLTHMLFCIIAGKPGSCFGITSRVRNEWEVAKRGMCKVIKFWCIQLEYTHWMMNISSLLYRPHCIWWNQSLQVLVGAGLSSPNLSPTPFFHFLCSRIIYRCFHLSSWLQLAALFFTCKILRRGMQEQIPWSIFHMIKNWAASGLMSGWANPLRLFWGSGCFITPTPLCRDKGICSICDKQKYWEARDRKALCGGWPGVVGRK